MWSNISDAASNPVSAFLIAILALLCSLAALSLQFRSHKESGPLVEVEAWPYFETDNGKRMDAPLDSIVRRLRLGDEEKARTAERPSVVIKVVSTGRMPVTVNRINIRYSSISFGEYRRFEGPDFPCRLEAGESKSWRIGGKSILRWEKMIAEDESLYGFRAWIDSRLGRDGTKAQVFLGNGQVVRSNRIRFLSPKEANALRADEPPRYSDFNHTWDDDELPPPRTDLAPSSADGTPTQPLDRP
ncbi:MULTISPECIES: hypothetical protein [Glycomyces]|uniref:Uncharacterized protein n=1 Tax=Glycomyces lechevalierae TaxID=256034 RepID=A0A9X3PK78_9ACTN|nr:hypothetical protein [Glycomyces lechevalierae]MDA1386352.1 hypothetical protein [Glycomyces lechevalierae]MDR7338867.1 hypothetical protein [Glycomyces lechevalierae]